MKKIKWTIMTIAICLSLGGAFATAPQTDCRTLQAYYATGGTYMPAGTFGVSFLCDGGSDVCTYTFDGINYWPCRQGEFRFVTGVTNTPSKKAAKK